MTPKSVNDIHKRGGTVLGTSRGGHDTKKIVDNIQDRGINQVCLLLLITVGLRIKAPTPPTITPGFYGRVG